MARLIDADKLISSLNWLVESGMTGNKTKAVIKLAIQTADGQPTVDAVEVVRCKDCFHFWDGVCKGHIDVIYMDDNDFCSCGERKEVGNEQ